jgi:hypothetical protein
MVLGTELPPENPTEAAAAAILMTLYGGFAASVKVTAHRIV